MRPRREKKTDDKKIRTVSWSAYVDEMALKYTEQDGVKKFSSISNMVETAMNQMIVKLEATPVISNESNS